MAYTLSERASQLLNQTNIEPNIVLCIDGYPIRFGVEITKVYVKIGMPGLKIGGGWKIGGVIGDETIVDYISLDGTTTSVTQQLDLDKSGATSTQTIKMRLIDFDQQITRLISPGFDLNDILYRNCQLYLGFKEGAFPQDYVDFFIGKIQTVDTSSGFVELTIANPEELKRSEIFTKIETTLAADAPYYSKVIQDLTYQQVGTFNGVVQVRYLNVPFFAGVDIDVTGNLISVTSDNASATAVKTAIENDPETIAMVRVLISGNGATGQVAQAITDLEVSDELELSDVTGLFEPVFPIFRTYVRINDELIEYTGIDVGTNTLTGCTRRTLDSVGGFHKLEDQVDSFYKLGDDTENSNAIDLALMVMISDGIGDPYLADVSGIQFYNFGSVTNYPNGFLITGVDAVRQFNIQAGDTCTMIASTIPGNNFVDGIVEALEVIDIGTIVYIEGAVFTPEPMSVAVASFKSQYNVLPDGCGYIPAQIDIKRFKEIQDRFPSSIANYELYLKDTIKSKDLINTSIFLPSAIYSIPRQGRASIGIAAPPLYEGGTKILDLSTVKAVDKIKQSRSVNKYFYNAIVYKYNDDSIDDRQLSGRIIYSADSEARVKSPLKPFTIKAGGIRPSAINDQLIARNCKRFLQRFQFAAETIPVQPDYKTGFSIEVGDAVVFGEAAMQLSDSLSGTRDYKPRVFEVVNKTFDWKNGSITLNIVDTNYSAGVRYGVWSPASLIGIGSTTSRIQVEDSFGSDNEKEKWTPYFNKTVRLRSEDYSTDEMSEIKGFDAANDHIMIVDPPFTTLPTEGMLIDVPNYDDLNLNADSFYKALHPFWTPTLTIVSGTSSTEFEVSAPDAAKIYVGSLLRIHDEDYTIDSNEKVIKVTDITGTTITCGDIGFTPTAGQKIDLIGFVSDKGAPYTWV